MKYEFHVGDYVETKDGWIGYVNEIYSTDNSLDIVWTSGNGIIGKIVHADWELLYGELARIGQYDFKKDKVEPLSINKHISIYCGNGKTNYQSDYKTAFEQDELNDKMIDKINEIVDAVNRLEEKVNGMA